MTEGELRENTALHEEASKREEESNDKIYRVRGPAGNRKIVEIRKDSLND